jgi:hypothetical protein
MRTHVLLSLGAFLALPTTLRGLRPLSMQFRGSPLLVNSRMLRSRAGDSKEKEYVEVEIIDTKKRKKVAIDDVYEPRPSIEPAGLLGFAKRAADSVVGGVAKLFGRDEESMRRKQRTAAFNAEIDRAVQGTGLVGGMLGRLAKSMGGAMINTLAEGVEKMENVKNQVENLLNENSESAAALGQPVQLFHAISTSAHSTNINGKSVDNIVMIIPVQGSRSSGQVQVVASSNGGKEMTLKEVVLQLDTGRVIEVPVRPTPTMGKIIDV